MSNEMRTMLKRARGFVAMIFEHGVRLKGDLTDCGVGKEDPTSPMLPLFLCNYEIPIREVHTGPWPCFYWLLLIL